jgi:PAS domain-containing protein
VTERVRRSSGQSKPRGARTHGGGEAAPGDTGPHRTDELAGTRLLASIIHSSDDAIVAKSLDGTIQSWNAGAERISDIQLPKLWGVISR